MPWSSVTLSVQAAVRTQVIGFTLVRSGLWKILSALGLEITKRGLRIVRVGSPKIRPLDTIFGTRLSLLLAELGPTFIKLGQMLACRPDLTTPAIAEELKCLFDAVPPVPFRKIMRVIESELGRRAVKEHFISLESKPLASASLAQTHRGVLKNGDPVIVKVQKPGAAGLVRVDLAILEQLARSIQLVYPKMQAVAVFNDFKQATLKELDYREEATNIDRFQRNYRKLFFNTGVTFPINITSPSP